MAVYSPLRYRRFSKERAEKTYQFIGFRLRETWFGLPIEAMEKATVMGVDRDSLNEGSRLIQYEGRELLIIDVDRQIFGDEYPSSLKTDKERCLAIIKHENGNLLGLPLDSPPSVFRILESAFSPLPETLLGTSNIKCIKQTMARLRDGQELLLLDPDLLFQNAA